jgi:hypothetical protein
MRQRISEFLELGSNNLFLFISLSEGEPKAADKLILLFFRISSSLLVK